ncbi:hypothetical protein V5799_020563 [Amblyomma americanum]|uniref:Uncharacterized protein n=1 Tax=Amblyomma americanum TaxID=6943 RepID=A0AAQ4ETH4_AMBAM
MAVQQDDDIFTQTLDDSDDEVGRGELIHAYQALIDRTAEEENVSSSLLTETIGMAENLFEAVTRTHEAAVDSTLMRAVTSHGRKLAAAALPEQTLDTEEFADRVRSVVSSSLHASTLDIKAWAKLADFAAGALKTSAPFWYLYGSAGEAPIKVRRARAVREVAPDRPPTLPKEHWLDAHDFLRCTCQGAACLHCDKIST